MTDNFETADALVYEILYSRSFRRRSRRLQGRGWRAPPMVEEADSGSWSPDPAAPPPCFSPTARQSGAGGGAETDSDGDEIDLTGGPTEPPDSPTRTTATITTARCPVDYNVDWGGVEGALLTPTSPR